MIIKTLESHDDAWFLEQINNILTGKRKVNDRYACGTNLLFYAITYEQYDHARYLIQLGSDINVTSWWHHSMLYVAVAYKQFDFAEDLIKLGADVNVVTMDGSSALLESLKSRNMDFVQKLLQAGANIRESNKLSGRNALHYALQHGQTNIILELIKMGMNVVDIVYENNRTILDFFIQERDYNRQSEKLECIGILIAHGARCNLKHDEHIFRQIDLLMNKVVFLQWVSIKVSNKNSGILSKLPVELIQMIHFVLCGDLEIDPNLLKGYFKVKHNT